MNKRGHSDSDLVITLIVLALASPSNPCLEGLRQSRSCPAKEWTNNYLRAAWHRPDWMLGDVEAQLPLLPSLISFMCRVDRAAAVRRSGQSVQGCPGSGNNHLIPVATRYCCIPSGRAGTTAKYKIPDNNQGTPNLARGDTWDTCRNWA